eukprot:TRINITY_DN44945_c0_g1_i1.p1 TRINITY_DN44945_c0_g1~~TRINITY_DN44945_c0_g1_i1.p1  ORF type:complete len:1084 (-),score=173.94 TRINITY_DN44945_c0_g1_i1:76-2907(-)
MLAFFYTPEEIDGGCVDGPSEPLLVAIEVGVDDRLLVTTETFETMLKSVPNYEIACLLDAYAEYVQAMDMAWQVRTLEESSQDTVRIKCAAGIAIWHDHAYVSDASQHVIFCVNMLTDEVTSFCGARDKPGFYDGPRQMARFRSPAGLALCEHLSTLYVCDTGNDAIRTVSIPSGVVHTLSLSAMDPELRLTTPIGICAVRGDYEYEKDSEEEEEDDGANGDDDDVSDMDEDEGRHAPVLDDISEEDSASSHQSSFSGRGVRSEYYRGQRQQQSNARYAFATEDPPSQKPRGGMMAGAGRPHLLKGISKECWSSPRRASGYLSYVSSMSSVSSRRTSTLFSMTPGESAKDSLRECADEDTVAKYNLAVTSDHCIFLVQPEKGEFLVLAGSPNEYGYRDAEKGPDARFSSLKGITCIRSCLFVADHWNNVIRCVNLKTRQVDTVLDFNPCGPVALTLTSSGSLYVLDTEHINVCNILKICSSMCSTKDADGALGTTVFRMIQESIGRSRSSSVCSNRDRCFVDALGRRGSARQCRRGSSELDSGSESSGQGSRRASRRTSMESCRRASLEAKKRHLQQLGKNALAGDISDLGPRTLQASQQQGRSFADSNRYMVSMAGHDKGRLRSHSCQRHSRKSSDGCATLPVVPKALRSLVPGASLHPALIQMTMTGNTAAMSSRNSAISGSQFHVSVLSSVTEDEDDSDNSLEFFSFLNPKRESPWKRIPIGTLQDVYQEATGQCSANTPQSLAYWDAADADFTAALCNQNRQQLIVGAAEFPAVIKVLPPRKALPSDSGRFRAVAVDLDRVVMADSDSNQIFVVNHTKRTKDKIAGCGKAGYLDGPLDVCRLNRPSSVALDPLTHVIYVADAGNHRIRSIDLSTGFMSTVCGNGIKGNQDGSELRHQSLDSPFDIHFMHPSHLLISCADNSIRRLGLRTSQLETILVGS